MYIYIYVYIQLFIPVTARARARGRFLVTGHRASLIFTQNSFVERLLQKRQQFICAYHFLGGGGRIPRCCNASPAAKPRSRSAPTAPRAALLTGVPPIEYR